jgi:hypothetical protein
MDKTTSLKGWLLCENQRVSAGDYKNFPQTPQILAEFIHKIILSCHLVLKNAATSTYQVPVSAIFFNFLHFPNQ